MTQEKREDVLMGASSVPKDVQFLSDTLSRIPEYGNNWCITWAAGDSQITSMGDGDWLNSRLGGQSGERKLSVEDGARNLDDPSEIFSLEEFGRLHQQQTAYPFSFVDFVPHGRDNSLALDDYIYGPEGAFVHQLFLAGVEKKQICQREHLRRARPEFVRRRLL